MSTDRELLELAARAAGYEGSWRRHWRSGAASYMVFAHPERFVVGRNEWNPIEDDGDAFRLAVQLGLWVHIGKYHAAIEGTHIEETARRGDSLAATRRAIVRAAAEIGKAMK